MTDHAVVIWEEREGGFKSLATPERSAEGFLDTTAGANNTTNTGSSGGTNEPASRWVNKASLSDARRAVTAVEFSPRHLGLRLASGSADGVVRIYEALDTMNLNHWKLEAEIEDNSDSNDGIQRMRTTGKDRGWRRFSCPLTQLAAEFREAFSTSCGRPTLGDLTTIIATC